RAYSNSEITPRPCVQVPTRCPFIQTARAAIASPTRRRTCRCTRPRCFAPNESTGSEGVQHLEQLLNTHAAWIALDLRDTRLLNAKALTELSLRQPCRLA